MKQLSLQDKKVQCVMGSTHFRDFYMVIEQLAGYFGDKKPIGIWF